MGLRRVVRTSQPQSAVGVDWGNPISKGLFLCHTPGLANGALAFTKDAVVSSGVASVNRGLLSTDPRVAGPITVLLCFKTPAVFPYALNDCAIAQGGSNPATNNQGFGFSVWHGSPIYSGAIYGGTGYVVIGRPTGGALAASTDYVVAVSVDASGAVAGYSKGIKTVSGTIVARDTAARLSINANSALSPAHDDGANLFSCVLVWSRVLSDAEVASISANPWQLFAPISTPIFVPIPAAVTVYRPGTDVSGSWTAIGAASVAGALFDESESNYGESPDLSTSQTCTWNPPLPTGTWSLPVVAERTATGGQVRIVCLDAGGVSVGATAWQALTVTPSPYTLAVTTSATATQFRIEVQP